MPSLKETIDQASSALTPQVEGLENVPAEGAAIIAFNHVGTMDALLARMVDGRRIHFAAAKDRTASVRGWLPRRSRSRRPESESDDLTAARRVLERGDLLGIFPEGDRSPDGSLHRGEPTLARLEIEARVPVIPAVVLQQGALVPPRLVFGAPVDLDRFLAADRLPTDILVQALTDAVMDRLRELSGQTYVDLTSAEHRLELDGERTEVREAARAAAAERKAAEQARIEQRRADRAAEAAELAHAQAVAAVAAREQARRAAEADRTRRDGRRSSPSRPTDGALGESSEREPLA